ncbi:MAG: SipW-dependent-type signal peptide-containing protein [Candidatus Paceibacterota bacterium]
MKKIILSLGTLVTVAALAVGGTIAFYNDSETSTGNIFVAGAVDLKVDHLKQSYNGMDCETCALELFSSDGQNYVTDSSDNATVQGGFPFVAPLVSNPHQNWTSHGTADWVWAQDSTSVNDSGNIDVEYTFERDFQWNGDVGDVTFQMALASDNGFAIYLNNDLLIDELDTEYNYNAVLTPLNGIENDFKNALNLGSNTLKIVVRNHALSNGTPSSNPGGLLYYLNIERTDCEDDIGFKQACRLWSEKDLGNGDTFFNFGDIKPGDEGTNVISLHVYDNDSYACLIVHNGDDQENSLQEPEVELGDNDDNGELQDYIEFFAWIDNNDGVYQVGETALTDTEGVTLGELGSIASLDTEQHFLTGTSTEYIGLAWCAGDISVDGDGIHCNGAGMLNDAQSDSFGASLTAYAVQVRNNSDFSCEDVVLDEPEV